MKTYNEYKDSGIEWIGKIPKHWEVKKLKFVSNIFTGNSMNEETKSKYRLDIDNSFPYIATKDIDYSYSTIDYNNGVKIPYTEKDNFKIALKNSTLICIEGGSAGKKIGYLNQEVCFVNKLASIKAIKDNNDLYLYYLIKSNLLNIQFNSYINGLIGGVSIVLLKNIKGIFPPLEEQEQIANYLDTKTKQIDKVIQNTQIQIEKLKEYEKSLINKVVTKGLDENVELKDSGIEWIGKIPKHWEVKKLKYISKIILGQSVDSNSINNINEGIPFFQGKAEFGLIYPKIRFYTINPIKIANKNDILISVRAPVGDLNISNCKCCIGRGLSAIRYHNHKYLYYILYSAYYEFNKFVTGSTFEAISGEDIKNIQIPFIVDDIEQEQIANYLDRQTKIIQKLIKNKQIQLNLYQELRKSVINDAVTGKVRVF